jgi:hypothetical protein
MVGYALTSRDADKPALRIWKVSPAGTLEWRRDLNLNVRTEVYDVISDAGEAVIAGEVFGRTARVM